jgi:hypothetical protein
MGTYKAGRQSMRWTSLGFKALFSGGLSSYNKAMFFFLVCVLVAVLLLTGHPPDQYGWMMLIGLSWLAGYLDCRKFAKSDQEQERVMPPDAHEPILSDRQIFKSK